MSARFATFTVFLALFQLSCSVKSDLGSRPSVLLITVDTLRADRLSAYGYTESRSPNIDRLAADGVLFETAVCDVTWTTPSMASVMTGTYATVHGFRSGHVQALGQRNITLAEVLRDGGYSTAAVIGSFPLDSIYQLDQGFSHYDDHFTRPLIAKPGQKIRHVESALFADPAEREAFKLAKLANDSRRSDSEVTTAALARLESGLDQPFFLWVHYFGPHTRPTWGSTGGEDTLRHLENYDAYVRETDLEIGRLLNGVSSLGLDSKTLVILHADHGEALLEHGIVGHGFDLYEPVLRIPLIIRYPNKARVGSRVRELAQNVDIFPTVLEAVGVQIDHPISGKSLLPLLRYDREEEPLATDGERFAYAETFLTALDGFAEPRTLQDGSTVKVGTAWRGIRTRRWKYVRREPSAILNAAERGPELPIEVMNSVRTEELYDLTVDPGELNNLVSIRPAIAADLRAKLGDYLAQDPESEISPRIEIDDELKARLRTLGYSGD